VAIYVGAALEDRFYEAFLPPLLGAAGVAPTLETPPGVQAKVRRVRGEPLLFLLNCTTASQPITLPQPMHDVLLDRPVGRTFVLPPRDVVALRSA